MVPAGDVRDAGSVPGSGRPPGGGRGKPAPVLLPGESHGQRSLAGCSPWGRQESDTAEAHTYMRIYMGTSLGSSTISPTAGECWEARDVDLHKRHFASGMPLYTVESAPKLRESCPAAGTLVAADPGGRTQLLRRTPRAPCWSFSLMSTS